MYHKLRELGGRLDPDAEALLNHVLVSWSIRQWEHANYPNLQGSAPAPAKPESEVCEILPDSDDE
jgi:hypothetical protein